MGDPLADLNDTIAWFKETVLERKQMPRGRQYYDPIIQAPSRVESAGTRRIELFPEGDVTDSAPGPLRWVARLIGDDGLIVEKTSGSFDHDDALRQAQGLWPGLEVFELREESEDSTHEGMGPSPRLWQSAMSAEVDLKGFSPTEAPPAAPDGQTLRAFTVSAGTYMHLGDVLEIIESYAAQFDGQGNPSGALALREAAVAFREATVDTE